ncbi:MAG: hemolysin family protein [Myxococcota bacterium]|nr:hemolysin family protein [Myxococcota bacterium]
MTTLVIAVCISVFVSALCSILESILYSTRVVTLEARAAEGSGPAKVMRSFKADIDRPLSAILIMNTLANTAGAALAGWAAGQVWGASSLWIFSLVFTLMILLFSEILPKTVGAVYWRSLWPLSVWPLRGMLALLWPLVWAVRFMTGLITLKGSKAQLISEDEIIAAAKLSAHGGEISHTEAEMIRNVIRLEEILAEDIMTPRTVILSADGDRLISDIRKDAENWRNTRVPVYEGNADRLIGYVLRYEICGAKSEEMKSPVKTLAKPIRFVSPTVSALTLLNRFLSRREHLYAVADEYGGVAGLVTMEDVIEALVGKEIVDEKDDVIDTQALAKEKGKGVIEAIETESDSDSKKGGFSKGDE